jgi:hypothetical protein
VAVRSFNGTSDFIQTAAGTLGTLVRGANTFAMIVKLVNDSDKTTMSFGSGTTPLCGLVDFLDAGTHKPGYQSNAGGSLVSGAALVAADGWVLVGFTKGSGSVKPRLHLYNYGTATWLHVDADAAVADQAANTVDGVFFGESANGSSFAAIRLALAGAWKSTLSDANFESGMHASLGAWSALAPDALCPFNQASTADPVADVTGNGADQTSISGTSVVTGDDPPGFNFSGVSGPAKADQHSEVASIGTKSTAAGGTSATHLSTTVAGVKVGQGPGVPATHGATAAAGTKIAITVAAPAAHATAAATGQAARAGAGRASAHATTGSTGHKHAAAAAAIAARAVTSAAPRPPSGPLLVLTAGSIRRAWLPGAVRRVWRPGSIRT